MQRTGLSIISLLPSVRLQAAPTKVLHNARAFSSYGAQCNVLRAAQMKPFSWATLATRQSTRTFMTDQATIIRPTREETRKRFGITAVRILHDFGTP